MSTFHVSNFGSFGSVLRPVADDKGYITYCPSLYLELREWTTGALKGEVHCWNRLRQATIRVILAERNLINWRQGQ